MWRWSDRVGLTSVFDGDYAVFAVAAVAAVDAAVAAAVAAVETARRFPWREFPRRF